MSKAFDLMKERKELLRKAAKEDGAKGMDKVEEQARKLYEQAQDAGGLTSEEAQALALL